MYDRVRVTSPRCLSLYFVPLKEHTVLYGSSCEFLVLVLYLKVTLEECLEIAALLMRGEATEHVHLVLDEACTVTVTLRGRLVEKLGLSGRLKLQCIRARAI